MKKRMHGTMIALAVAASLMLAAQEADAGARRSRPVKTGQTFCYNASGTAIDCAGTGQDGELQRGEPRRYIDLGDGTIRDQRTALMWEKLSDDGSIHDKDDTFAWEDAFAVKIALLNTPPCFAGFCDWRLPNRFELETLLNLQNVSPAVSPAFDTACLPACTVLTCSCTASNGYWSSTTNRAPARLAWYVHFLDGAAFASGKTNSGYVRAVRGGS